MTLYDLVDQKEIEVEIKKIEIQDFELIKTAGQFVFDWLKEKGRQIYKVIKSDEEIIGLISFTDYPKEQRIHIELLESSKPNIGKDKWIEGIAGCLIAFTARKAFEKGYNGFVSLVPKTILIDHYVEKYGFSKHGKVLIMEGIQSIELINRYS